MLIEISSIKGNSGEGSAVFSKPGQMQNTMYKVFNKESQPRKPAQEEVPFDYHKWKKDVSEMQNKEKFKKALIRFDQKQKRGEMQERLAKFGFSKSLNKRKTPDDDAPRRKDVPKIGDIKKDKLKNSMGMTNEEKDKLVAREKEMSRNRGVCMVSKTLILSVINFINFYCS